MPLLDGPSLGGNARHVLRQYAEESALARGRAANAAGTEEFGGGCLRGRYNNLREVIQNNPSLVVVPSIINAGSLFVQRPICRTNYLPNNSMAGATGSVLPTNWSIASLPAGITVSYSASGTAVAADGTSVNYIDVTVSGTAGASGFLNIRPNPSPSTIAAFIGQSWNTSVYLQLISGSVASVSPTWQLQELNSSQGFLQGSNIGGLGSLVVGGQFDRYNVSRVLTDSATAFVTCRWGHIFVSGTTYSYTLRIGSPQLERFSVPTPMIATSTGAVTRLNESTNVVGLPPDFTVSRNTGATRVGPNGLIETAKTNLALQSEAFDVSGTWSRNLNGTGLSPSVTANSVISPDGSQTAETVVFDRGAGNTINDRSFLEQSITIPTTGTYIFSVYAKASAAGDVGKQIFIRLGAAGGLIPITLTANWTRYSQSEASLASGSQIVQIGNRGTITADNSVSVDLWGAQVEVGSTASEYIPTTTVARTRFAGVTVDGTIAANIPRIDWFRQSCPALLVEASGQNLAWHSETWASGNNWDLTNGVTTATGSTSAFTAPNGTTTANAISPTSGNVFHYAGSNSTTQITYTSGTIYTQSAFFKAGTGTAGQFVQLTSWFNVATQNAYANYDLQNGLVTVVSGSEADANRSARIDNYGNGWYRCIFTFTANANGTERGVRPVLITASGSTRIPAFAGTVTDVLYVWGAQLETGSVATTYIPTTSGAVSRAADVISASGALVSGLIGQTEGTIYAEVDVRNAGTNCVICLSNNSSSTQLRIRASINSLVIANTVGGSTTTKTLSPTLSGVNKIALSYASGDYAVYLNGTQLDTYSDLNPPTPLIRVDLGMRQNNTEFFNNHIRAAALYTTRLSNDQLANLTALT